MFGPAEALFPVLWNILPQRAREHLSKNILALQSRTGLSIPLSEVKVYGKGENLASREPSQPLPPYSLVCTCYNEARSITRWLDSVASQTYAPREVVIVDGGSRDGTPRMIEDWKKSKGAGLGFEIRVIADGRKNISEGRNRAAAEAREAFLAFTDAGCELDRFWAERILEPFAADPATEVSMGWYRPILRTAFGAAMEKYLLPQFDAIDPATFLPSGRSLAIKKDVFTRSGGYPEYLTFAGEDSLFDYYLKCQAERFAFVPEALVYWSFPENAFALFRTTANYARGDAEGGKLFWLYYVNLLREHGKLALEAAVVFLVSLLNSLVHLRLLTWITWILLALMFARFLALVAKYRPLEKGGIFSKGGILSVLAVMLLVTAQGIGFAGGLLARKQVERRRRAAAPAGLVFVIVPLAPVRGGSGPEFDRIRSLLEAGNFVTLVFQAYPKKSSAPDYDHQFLDSYLRSNFQFDAWWARESTFSHRRRTFVDLVGDSISRGVTDSLRAAGFEPLAT